MTAETCLFVGGPDNGHTYPVTGRPPVIDRGPRGLYIRGPNGPWYYHRPAGLISGRARP